MHAHGVSTHAVRHDTEYVQPHEATRRFLFLVTRWGVDPFFSTGNTAFVEFAKKAGVDVLEIFSPFLHIICVERLSFIDEWLYKASAHGL
jgi:hypothetical protein